MDKKVVETRYVHDSWGITICCGRLLRGGVDWNLGTLSISSPKSVASFAEAWIEIHPDGCFSVRYFVASFAEAWIEIITFNYSTTNPACRLLRGGVDWNCNFSISPLAPFNVASFAEAWIEIACEQQYIGDSDCRLLRGGVDWNVLTKIIKSATSRRLLRGGVDWNLI